MSTTESVALDPELLEVLLKALDKAQEPVTAEKVRKDLPRPYMRPLKVITEHLSELVQSDQAIQFEPYKGRSPRYWRYDLNHYAKQLLLEAVAKSPSTWSELCRALKSPLKGYSDARLGALKKELLDKGELHELPSFLGGRSARFSNRPPDPTPYIDDAIKQIKKKLAKRGVTAEQVDEAARRIVPSTPREAPLQASQTAEQAPPAGPAVEDSLPAVEDSLPAQILDRMVDIDPGAANGALVRLRELRRAMDFQNIEKADFDRAVLHLADEGKVALHRHDYPAGLSEQDREELVTDGSGDYFVGIALR
jgi:hypothetical protein